MKFNVKNFYEIENFYSSDTSISEEKCKIPETGKISNLQKTDEIDIDSDENVDVAIKYHQCNEDDLVHFLADKIVFDVPANKRKSTTCRKSRGEYYIARIGDSNCCAPRYTKNASSGEWESSLGASRVCFLPEFQAQTPTSADSEIDRNRKNEGIARSRVGGYYKSEGNCESSHNVFTIDDIEYASPTDILLRQNTSKHPTGMNLNSADVKIGFSDLEKHTNLGYPTPSEKITTKEMYISLNNVWNNDPLYDSPYINGNRWLSCCFSRWSGIDPEGSIYNYGTFIIIDLGKNDTEINGIYLQGTSNGYGLPKIVEIIVSNLLITNVNLSNQTEKTNFFNNSNSRVFTIDASERYGKKIFREIGEIYQGRYIYFIAKRLYKGQRAEFKYVAANVVPEMIYNIAGPYVRHSNDFYHGSQTRLFTHSFNLECGSPPVSCCKGAIRCIGSDGNFYSNRVDGAPAHKYFRGQGGPNKYNTYPYHKVNPGRQDVSNPTVGNSGGAMGSFFETSFIRVPFKETSKPRIKNCGEHKIKPFSQAEDKLCMGGIYDIQEFENDDIKEKRMNYFRDAAQSTITQDLDQYAVGYLYRPTEGNNEITTGENDEGMDNENTNYCVLGENETKFGYKKYEIWDIPNEHKSEFSGDEKDWLRLELDNDSFVDGLYFETKDSLNSYISKYKIEIFNSKDELVYDNNNDDITITENKAD